MEKILIVTGEARSGTSLMMRILNELGIPISYKPLPLETIKEMVDGELVEKPNPAFREISGRDKMLQKKMKRSKELNPNGYFEHPGIVFNGVTGEAAQEHYGKALKVLNNGVRKMDTADIEKIIVCLRDPLEVANSQLNLISNILVSSEGDWEYSPSMRELTPDKYIVNMGLFLMWLNQHTELAGKVLFVDLSDLIDKKSSTIDSLHQFLGVNAPDRLINTKALVSGKNKKSFGTLKWKEGSPGIKANEVYEALKTAGPVPAGLEEEITSIVQKNILESVNWIDTEFDLWTPSTPGLHRSLLTNNNGVLTKLSGTAKNSNSVASDCPYHTRGPETYTIKRPVDIGDLVRNVVLCRRDNAVRTIEECFVCWTRGSDDVPAQRRMK